MTDERLIYHVFADTGVEAEPLSAYGTVVRVGLDPPDLNESSPIKADARSLPLKPGADLSVWHPPCYRWADGTPEDERQEHPNLIPLARERAPEISDHWIIENVPRAPLADDAVTLKGTMFGLPVTYERQFETSFHVEQPTVERTLPGTSWGQVQGTTGNSWIGDKDRWKSVKGVSGDYPIDPLRRSGIPAPYIHYLARWWLDALNGGKYAQESDVRETTQETLFSAARPDDSDVRRFADGGRSE